MKTTYAILLIFLLALTSTVSGQTAKEYYERGNAKIKLEDNAGAIADFTKAIEIDTNYIDAYSARGIAKKNLNDFTGARLDFKKIIEIVTKAIEIDPQNTINYKIRGSIKIVLALMETLNRNFIVGKELSVSGCLDFTKAAELGDNEANDLIKYYCW
jgi:tetratricopeptide (TPR) repeat protein